MNTKKTATLIFLSFFFLTFINCFSMNGVEPVQASYSIDRTFYNSSSDGYLYTVNINYGIARNASTTDNFTAFGSLLKIGQVWSESNGFFIIYRSAVYFDTSVIPVGANITGANLSFYLFQDFADTDFNITIQSGMPEYPHDPLQGSDFNFPNYNGSGGIFDTSNLSGTGRYNMSLNSQGLNWINPTGWTKFYLRSSRDINFNEPNGTEYITFYSREQGESKAPILYVSYTTENYYTATLYGAYDETGDSAGAINVTFFRPEQPAVNFELNGTYSVEAEADTRLLFEFDIGYNESRIYYWKTGVAYEDIYVFKPSEPFYTYYFTIIDFVGITNGYLETILNIKGIERVVERWRLDVLNDIPFTLSWGNAYKVRLICDQGTHDFGTFVAEATTSFSLIVTNDIFPTPVTDLSNITVSASRPSPETIQFNYTDIGGQTSKISVWINVYGTELKDYSYHNVWATSSKSSTWSEADPNADYVVLIEVEHDVRGNMSWNFLLRAYENKTNPWDFSVLGNWPIPSSQILGFAIVCLVFAAGNFKNAGASMILGVTTAAFLTWLGWLDIGWAWLAFCFGLAIIVAFSIAKEGKEVKP